MSDVIHAVDGSDLPRMVRSGRPLQVRSVITPAHDKGSEDVPVAGPRPTTHLLTQANLKVSPWEASAGLIRKRFYSARSYRIYDQSAAAGGTWTAGGCWIAAEAIKRTFGGTIGGIYSGAGLEHLVVEKQGHLIDALGRPAPIHKFLKKWGREEGITHMIYRAAPRDDGLDFNAMGVQTSNHIAATSNRIFYDEWAVTAMVSLLK